MTPQLVDAYKKVAGKKDRKVEIILVDHDTNQKAMDKYMVKSKINFPGLKRSETEKNLLSQIVKIEYLPTVILADANGKLISNDEAKVMSKLKELTK